MGSPVFAAFVASLSLSPPAARATASPAPTARFALQVRARNPMVVAALQRAGRDAAERLARPGCARIFSEFHDAEGRTLQQRLDALGRSGAEQLQSVYFYEGANRPGCQKGTFAFTEPGSVVVFVCPAFAFRQRQSARQAPEILIHELLHTLGLGENPPSSLAITTQVRMRCGR